MEQVIAFLVIFSMNFAIQSFPIENGFSVNFSPLSVKNESRPKILGTIFAKDLEEDKVQEDISQEILTTDIRVLPEEPKVASGYPNHMAKLLYPSEYVYKKNIHNITKALADHWAGLNFLNLPIVTQPYDNYKVLVATAPPNVHLGGDNRQTFIYVVFPEESSDTDIYNVPVIYFVNGKSAISTDEKIKSVDPILIVDNNRTVTGLKSREVAKQLSFSNKLTNRFKYWLLR